MQLSLGVLDVPYAGKDGATTGDVAQWNETKYHILEIFFYVHQQEIADIMADSVAGTIEQMFFSTGLSPFAEAMPKIEVLMKKFLFTQEIEGLGIAGVPTKAALEGVNHRLKIKHGSIRPSFIDTGLMEAAYKAWVDKPLADTPEQLADIARIQSELAA